MELNNFLLDFLEQEIISQEIYDMVLKYIFSPHVRNSEFRCSMYIIRKMDQRNYIIFDENISVENKRKIDNAFSIYRNDLVCKINEYANKNGIDISMYENFEEDYSFEQYFN